MLLIDELLNSSELLLGIPRSKMTIVLPSKMVSGEKQDFVEGENLVIILAVQDYNDGLLDLLKDFNAKSPNKIIIVSQGSSILSVKIVNGLRVTADTRFLKLVNVKNLFSSIEID